MNSVVDQQLWNVAGVAETKSDARKVYWDIVSEVFGNTRPLDILEIGVYRGALVGELDGRVNVRSYTGVDPYIGSMMDSYFRVYWSGSSGAESVYRDTKAIFDARGFDLVRAKSADYWKRCDRSFDVIIIDGDHSYEFALWDTHHWFKKLRPGGLMLIDDYDNPETPQVTRAANDFLRRDKAAIANIGYRHYEFRYDRHVVPVGMSVVYVQKGQDATAEPRTQDFPASLAFHNMVLRLAASGYRIARRMKPIAPPAFSSR